MYGYVFAHPSEEYNNFFYMFYRADLNIAINIRTHLNDQCFLGRNYTLHFKLYHVLFIYMY